MASIGTFFWSDPHFFHKNVIKLCNRPFSSLEEMHAHLIERYNSVVGPDDTCIWVGDCFFSKNTEKCREIMNALNGKKVLVRGNHDHSPIKMLNIGFASVHESIWLEILGRPVQVSHYPFRVSRALVSDKNEPTLLGRVLGYSKHRSRFANRHPEKHGQYLIHGHTHSKRQYNGMSIHVGVDANLFTPVPIHTIERYILQEEQGW